MMRFGIFLREPMLWVEAVLSALPGHTGVILRRWWFGLRLNRVGPKCTLASAVLIEAPHNMVIGGFFTVMRYSALRAVNGELRIGDRVSINSNAQITASDGGRISIGDDVLIGPNVILRASNHRFDDLSRPIRQQGHSGGEIVVERDVWIAANAVLLPGARIGQGAVVAAGAVVNTPVAANTIVAGVPAKFVRLRGSREELAYPRFEPAPSVTASHNDYCRTR